MTIEADACIGADIAVSGLACAPESTATRLKPMDVVQSYEVGVFSYLYKPGLTAAVIPDALDAQLAPVVRAALTCYRMLGEGHQVRCLGVDATGVHEAGESAPLALVPAATSPRH